MPVLLDDGFAVWDTLAIAEYLAERFPAKQLWPADAKARARARSVCAEMHSGFTSLRSHFPMNIEAKLPEIGAKALAEQPGVRTDLDRIVTMWTELLREHGGPLLFGEFSIADAYFAPVVMRPATYAPPLPEAITAYMARVQALPGVAAWSGRARRAGLPALRGTVPHEALSAAHEGLPGRRRGARRVARTPSGDRDWVVVGATPAEMIEAGYQPVGRDFPVFLHPQTHEEYALARTERKTAPGYRGFVVHAAPEVTLEDDLARRDLTINAMARDAEGALVDPHGGTARPAGRVLRHVSPAFAEDPVRILRLARFAARLHDFSVAPRRWR